MTRYYAKIKNWPIELDAQSLSELKKLAMKYLSDERIAKIQLVNVHKCIEKTVKLKPISVKRK